MSQSVEQARSFIPQLAELAQQTEQNGLVASCTISALRDAKLLNLLTPQQYGGQESNFTTAFNVARTLAHGCMSTAWVATVGNVHNWMAASFSEQCQADYFTDPDVFSSASFAPTGTAKTTDDGFIVSGTWGFLSGVDHAQWAFIVALTSDATQDRPAGPWFLMVPVADIEVLDDSWHVTGMAGTGSKSASVRELFVPSHRAAFLPALRGNQGPGAGTHQGQLYQAAFQPALIAVLAAPILGATERALEQFIDYTKNRTVKMTGGAQAQQVPSQLVVAEVAAIVSAATLVLENVFRRIDDATPLQPLEHATIARDTAYCVNLLVTAMNKIIANAGGTAAQIDNPLQRTWRDVQVASNHAAVNFATNMQNWGAAVLTG